jgi:hypothetical protein
MGRRVTVAMVLALVLVLAASSAPAQDSGYEAPHHGPPSPFFQTMGPADAIRYADAGIQIEHDHPVGWALAEHRRLDHALAALQPQRKGVVDAYVVAVALDSDPNFGKEAREAARVLSRAAELMNPDEDVLVLYTTSHGAPLGIVYNDADQGFGIISPTRLAALIDGLGIKRRVVIISACFSGVFVPALAGPDTAILTAASSDRTSFGCQADSDWTFFGDALVNHALRKAQPLDAAGREAAALIADWEARGNLTPSQPQMQVGESAAQWLAILDKRTPRETSASVGVPAVSLLDPH